MSTNKTCPISTPASRSSGLRPWGSFIRRSPCSTLSIHWWRIVGVTEILPALKRDRYVTVFPNEIVERAQIEFVALLHSRFSQKFGDLQFAHLVSNRLPRCGGERNCFLPRRRFIHRHFFLEVFRRLFERELAERKFYIHFNPERA